MARVRDLWFSEVPLRDSDGKAVRGDDGRVVYVKRKSPRHPDNGGSKAAKRWLALWADPDGSEVGKAFHKESDAKAHGKAQEADVDRGEYIDPKAGKEKFGPLAEKYIRLRKVGGGSREKYDSVYRHHVSPAFAHRGVARIPASDVLEWLQGPLSKMSGSVQEAAYLIVAGTFDMAVADKLRRDNPARSPIISKPHAGHAEREAWTAELVWRVRDEHPEPYRALVDCAAGLGLRRGCAFALAEEDFDGDAGKVTIRRQLAWIGGRLVFKLPKGGKERTVPLPRGVAASVEAHKAKYPPVAVTLPWMSERDGLKDPVTVRLLFVWRGGGRLASPLLRRKTLGKPIVATWYDGGVWKPALSRAGVIPPPEKNARGTLVYRTGGDRTNGMHALRHHYESMLDNGGVSLAGMMEFMGHSRKGKVITIGVYGHVTEETFEQARQAVDARLFRLRPVAAAGTVTELRSAR